MSIVWLLKSDSSNQSYGNILNANNYNYKNISTLDFNFINLDILENAIKDPSKYSGIILTSARAVEAIRKLDKSVLKLIGKMWSSHKIFVVGKATCKTVNDYLELECIGQESGNAKQLFNIILDEVDKNAKPLLYLCGNLRRDELPNLLEKNNLNFQLIICYETIVHQSLEERMFDLSSSSIPNFIVFFSPSGVEYSLPIFEKLKIDLTKVKVIAIGPTTNLALTAKNILVYGVCNEPTPEGLIQILKI